MEHVLQVFHSLPLRMKPSLAMMCRHDEHFLVVDLVMAFRYMVGDVLLGYCCLNYSRVELLLCSFGFFTSTLR